MWTEKEVSLLLPPPLLLLLLLRLTIILVFRSTRVWENLPVPGPQTHARPNGSKKWPLFDQVKWDDLKKRFSCVDDHFRPLGPKSLLDPNTHTHISPPLSFLVLLSVILAIVPEKREKKISLLLFLLLPAECIIFVFAILQKKKTHPSTSVLTWSFRLHSPLFRALLGILPFFWRKKKDFSRRRRRERNGGGRLTRCQFATSSGRKWMMMMDYDLRHSQFPRV